MCGGGGCLVFPLCCLCASDHHSFFLFVDCSLQPDAFGILLQTATFTTWDRVAPLRTSRCATPAKTQKSEGARKGARKGAGKGRTERGGHAHVHAHAHMLVCFPFTPIRLRLCRTSRSKSACRMTTCPCYHCSCHLRENFSWSAFID